ncbi:MAG: extracellular solute-binding protein [Desulfobacterales bacterium]|nr:extracellular solute-binding protein [Desulfobacterales bacterium]
MKKTAVLVSGFLSVAFFAIFMVPPGAGADSLREQMIAKAKQEGTVIMAGNLADEIATAFPDLHKRYPFLKFQFLQMSTKDTVNRVLAEAQAGRTSFDWVGISEDGAEILAQQGALAKYDFPHVKDFRPGSQPPHGLYVGGMVNPRIQGCYNTNLVKPEEVPKSWEDMTAPRWKGRTMLSRSSEELPGRLAWLWRKDGKWDWDRAFDLFQKLKAHNPQIADGYQSGVQRVAAGEVDIFWFTTPGVVRRFVEKGAPLDIIVVPKFFGGMVSWGTLKGAAHPAAAWLLTDYLTSPEGQFAWTDFFGVHMPMNTKAKIGRFMQWGMDRGITFENLEIIDLANLAEIYAPEVQKKSEQWYFKLLGLR